MFTLTLTETPELIDAEFGAKDFEHFRHNFRTLPAEKLARIQAILAEPPPPQRKTRSDAGKSKTPKTTTPPQPTLDIQ